MSKATNIKNGNVNIKCEYCGGCGYHKMSCPTQKVTVFLSDEKTDNFFEEQEKKYLNGIRNQIDKLTPSDYEPMPKQTLSIFNTFIPTLEGDEAEEFIRKADENVRLMRQRLCKNHVWRKDYLNGGKKCQVCGKAKEEVKRSKDVEE
jgi:hypothetical protein